VRGAKCCLKPLAPLSNVQILFERQEGAGERLAMLGELDLEGRQEIGLSVLVERHQVGLVVVP
jgi:hypothetical protein